MQSLIQYLALPWIWPTLHCTSTTAVLQWNNHLVLRVLVETITHLFQPPLVQPHHNLHRFTILKNLAGDLLVCFHQMGKIGDLEEAIVYLRQLLEYSPPKHASHTSLLDTLAWAILKLFKLTGRMEDLEIAITCHRESLDLRPPGHSRRSLSLNNLASALLVRFDLTGRIEDLGEAILYFQESLDILPYGSPNRATRLNNFACANIKYFEATGRVNYLEKAIIHFQESLGLLPLENPSRATFLSNFADAILARFEQTGGMEDLEDTIKCHRQSLHLRSTGHPNCSLSLNNLAGAILRRFEWASRVEDVQEAIGYYRRSLDLCPLDHSGRSLLLTNLAGAIISHIDQTDEMVGLEEAIAYLKESLNLRPPGHPGRSFSLNNLAGAIIRQFEKTDMTVDIEEAIRYLRGSLDLLPCGNHNRAIPLSNLARLYSTRFEKLGRVEDLNNAASLLSDVETALPMEYPMHTLISLRIASIHLKKHDLDPGSHHLPEAFARYQHAVSHPTASIKARFKAAVEWASAAHRHRYESTLRAYSTSLALLHRYFVATPCVELQQKFLASAANIKKSLVCDAAASAIEAGKLGTTVEFLEQARAMLWSRMRDLRHPLEGLRKVDCQLADKFEALSAQLELHAMRSEQDFIAPLTESEHGIHNPQVSFAVGQQRYRVLLREWDGLVEKIRRIEGFSEFLRIKSFAHLQQAAVEGPVIIVNISRFRSDTIIVRNVDPPVVVSLPDAVPAEISLISSVIKDPKAVRSENFSRRLFSILRTLWKIIASPVIDQLNALGVPAHSRIWWCPTSHLCGLPLHAAGPYLPHKKSLPDLYISSYTSTLCTLMAVRSGVVHPTAELPNLLAIGGGRDLPYISEELHRIKSFGSFVNVLTEEQLNRNNVISGLQQHSWAHFACHSNRDTEPFHSAFNFYHDDLEVLDLIKIRLPNARHAFVNSCSSSAARISATPDEVINIVTALQFCGFRSLVGTLWIIADLDGPDIAADFYRYMFRESGDVPQFCDSAKALNITTKEMRKRKGMTLSRWAPFVHVGA